MQRFLFVILSLFLCVGCASIEDAAGDLVTFYCENVTVQDARDTLHAIINREAAPHAITIHCAPSEGFVMPTKNPYELQRMKRSEDSRVNATQALNAAETSTSRAVDDVTLGSLCEDVRWLTEHIGRLERNAAVMSDYDTRLSALQSEIEQLKTRLAACESAGAVEGRAIPAGIPVVSHALNMEHGGHAP